MDTIRIICAGMYIARLGKDKENEMVARYDPLTLMSLLNNDLCNMSVLNFKLVQLIAVGHRKLYSYLNTKTVPYSNTINIYALYTKTAYLTLNVPQRR
jgi:hypothetical protein